MKVKIEEIKINPEYEQIVQSLSEKDYLNLENSIVEDGLIYPLIINQNKTILDGHHRIKICKKHSIFEAEAIEKVLTDDLEEKEFVISCNLNRRHLNNAQKAELGLEIEKIETEKAKRRQGTRTDLNKKEESSINIPLNLKGSTKESGEESLEYEDRTFEETWCKHCYQNTHLVAGDGVWECEHCGAGLAPFDNPDTCPYTLVGIVEKEKGEALQIAADKVGVAKINLWRAKKIKEAAETDEEIAKKWEDAKKNKVTVNKVYKEVKRKEDKKEIEEKAKHVEVDSSFEKSVKFGDARVLIKDVESETIDLILTDPPYFVSEGKADTIFTDRTDIKKDQAEWDKQRVEILLELIPDLYRVLRDGGSVYIMTQDSLIGLLQSELLKIGFIPHATIVWHKTNPSPGAVKTQFCSSCEYIIFATKGEKHTFNNEEGWNRHNFMEGSICMGSERYLHPTQKPVYLFEKLMKISTNRGDTVLDLFAGTGTTGVVAKELERNFILFEKEKEYIDIIKVRLSSG